MALTNTVAAAAAFGLLVAACGTGEPLTGIEAGGDSLSAKVTTTITTAQQTSSSLPFAATSTTAAAALTTAAHASADAPNLYPDLTATDVATGQSVSLRSLGGTGTPAVLWFWYPH